MFFKIIKLCNSSTVDSISEIKFKIFSDSTPSFSGKLCSKNPDDDFIFLLS
ncbi:MAG: hypothetical protein P8M03_08500 [Flavobacteriaceae bacterium]|nr:hypothetical protein [Flavobacteriaceae bacterium]